MKLNDKTKTMLVSVTVMMGLLIVMAGVMLVKAKQNGSISLGEGLTSGLIIVLAVFSIFSVFIIRRLRAKHEPKLDASFRNTLEDIMAVIGTSNMSPAEKRQIREDLMDLFAEANGDGRMVSEVAGENADRFAADIIEAYGARNNLWTYLLSGVQFFIYYLLFVQLYTYFRHIAEVTGFFDVPLEVSTIILFGAISILAIPLLMLIKHTGIKRNKPVLIFVGYVIVTAAVFGLVLGIFAIADKGLPGWGWVQSLLNKEVVLFNSLWVWAAVIAVFALALWLKRRIRKKRLSNMLR